MKTILLGFSLVFPALGVAQSYPIDWYKIAGDGGTSINGQYSVCGTIGQPDASQQTLTGGFWALIAVQTPGAPTLTITLTTTNTAVVSWPYPSTGWDLQENSDLGTTNWIAPPETVNNDGTNNFIMVYPPAGNEFYRLFKP